MVTDCNKLNTYIKHVVYADIRTESICILFVGWTVEQSASTYRITGNIDGHYILAV